MKNILTLLVAVILVFFLSAGCDKIKDLNTDPQSGKDFVTAESTFSSVYKTIGDAVQKEGLMEKSGKYEDDAKSCPEISITSLPYPRTLTIAFDPVNGCDIEGVNFKGTITCVMSGPFKSPGSILTASFSNFYVNDNKVDGQKVITNLGRNNSNQLRFKVEVKSGHITTENGGHIYYSTTKTWTWKAGEATEYPVLNDDIWEVTGNANGTNIDGKSFSASIDVPLLILVQGCSGKTEIVSGKVIVKPDEGKDITIDYGNGTCDGKATLSIPDLAVITIELM